MVGDSKQCNRGVTDKGKTGVGAVLEALSIAVAGYNTATGYYIAKLQYDIAKTYLDIAKWWRDYYNNNYVQWENQELSEAKDYPYEIPEYDITVGRTMTYGRIESKGKLSKLLGCTHEYSTGLRKTFIKEQLISDAVMLANLANMGYRNEDMSVNIHNDVRFQFRIETLNRGRNMQAGIVSFANLANGIYGDLGTQVRSSGAGAMRYLAYSRNSIEVDRPILTFANESTNNTQFSIMPVRNYTPDPSRINIFNMSRPSVIDGTTPISGAVYNDKLGMMQSINN